MVGWPWDAVVGNTNFSLAPDTIDRLASDPTIIDMTTAQMGNATINGEPAFVMAMDSSGTAPPAVSVGRLPALPSEVALGAARRRELGVNLGETVTLSMTDADVNFALGGSDAHDVTLTVVGEASPPPFGDRDIGEDAIITFDGLVSAGGKLDPQLAMARLRRHDRAADIAALDRNFTEEIYTDFVPARIVNLYRVRSLPTLGLVLAGGMGAVVLAFTLITGVRSRQRDLDVLRALGMEPHQLRGVLAWQGIALAGAVVVLGLPVRLVAGAQWWRAVADGLGVSTAPAVPKPLWLVIPLTTSLAVSTSIYAGRRARPNAGSAILHTE